MILNRHTLTSGAYLENFADLPEGLLWSKARIAQSLVDTLAQRPEPAHDVWVLAYGSLMWNPLTEFDARVTAQVSGWHRSFCMNIVAGRGSPEHPGRMLSLEPGGELSAMALRIPRPLLETELSMLWIREMVTGAYQPKWIAAQLAGHGLTPVIAFVAAPEHVSHRTDTSAAVVSPLIAQAHGRLGSNADYIFTLQQSLTDAGLHDPYIDEIAQALHEAGVTSTLTPAPAR